MARTNRNISGLFYLWDSVLHMFIISAFCSVMSDPFSRRQAKHLIGEIAAGKSIGVWDSCRVQMGLFRLILLFLGSAVAAIAWADDVAPSIDAQAVVRSATVTTTTEHITIDGVLDERIWSSAPTIGALIQRQPQAGGVPTERTEVALLRDANYIYIGVIAYDSDPDRMIGTQMARDASLSSDDRVEILLDTYHDQRNAFYFATNPSGAMVDGLAANGELNTDWDAIWEVRTKRTDLGWVSEFAIPFKSLNFPAQRTEWGFNISRTVHRKLEEIRWSGARLETDFLQVSEAGVVTNLTGLTQGIGLDIRPFVAGRWSKTKATGRKVFTTEPGLDISYSITPSMKLTATANTDFGETEVDARQINLTRYSLFFPEKRSFFLEDAGIFNFSSTGPEPPGGIPPTGADVYPFFSRRIGLLNGEEVPIDVGVKLTGKIRRMEIGILDVLTDNTINVEDKDFIVGRVKQNLFEQSYVGAIFTDGYAEPGRSGQTYGADLRLATSHFLGRPRNFVMTAYGVRSAAEGPSNDDLSYGFSARYPNDKFDAQIVLKEIQQNFDPGIGFVQRDNVQMIRVAVSYNPRPKDFLNIQQMFHDVFYTRFKRLDNGQVESWDLYVTPWDWHFNSGDALHSGFDINLNYEQLFEPFEISPGVFLPPGEYRFNRYKQNFTSASKRRLSGSVSVTWGDFWSGRAEQITTSLTYKHPPWLTVSFSTNQTFAQLPEGKFIARILTANVNYAASPFLSLSNLIQYDNRSRNLGWQSRVRWTVTPGNDVFFVFKQGWIHEEMGNRRFTAQDSEISTKLQYTFRF